MHLEKQFDVKQTRAAAIACVAQDETLLHLFPDTQTEIVERHGNRRTLRSPLPRARPAGHRDLPLRVRAERRDRLREGLRRPRLARAEGRGLVRGARQGHARAHRDGRAHQGAGAGVHDPRRDAGADRADGDGAAPPARAGVMASVRRERRHRCSTPRRTASGVPVLLSCGLCTTHENWRPQVAPLGGRRAARRALGLPRPRPLGGAARSGRLQPEAGGRRSRARARLGRGRASRRSLGGLSFGGLASLHFALAEPARVRALLLVDTGPGFKNPEAQARWQAQVERTASFLETRGCQAFIESKAAATAIGLRPELPAAQAAARAIAAQDPAGLALFARRIAAVAPPVIDQLRADRASRRWWWWARRTSPTCGPPRCWPRACRKAESVTLARAGHVVNLEEPEAFDAAVLGFLARLSPPAILSDPAGSERNRSAAPGFPSRAEAAVDAPDEDALLMLALRAGDRCGLRRALPALVGAAASLSGAHAAGCVGGGGAGPGGVPACARRSRALRAPGALLDLALPDRDEPRAQRAAAAAPA